MHLSVRRARVLLRDAQIAGLCLLCLGRARAPLGCPIVGCLIVGCLVLTVGLVSSGAAQVPTRTPPTTARQQPRPRGALAPKWIPLDAEHQQYLDKILNFWEHTTSGVKRYRSEFQRWEYEGQGQLKTYSTGALKYQAPDKGMFKVEKMKHRGPAGANGEPVWVDQEQGFREHWICDGKSVFEFDHTNKQLKQRRLPAEMQGKQIAEGPLPFLFGAKADQIKQRFWLRVLPPKAQNQYWLEAIPKTQRDAANFRSLIIIIDGNDFLPDGMEMHHRGQAQTTFKFDKRETNWNKLVKFWEREFYAPKTPSGWKKVMIDPGQPAVPLQATRQREAPGRK